MAPSTIGLCQMKRKPASRLSGVTGGGTVRCSGFGIASAMAAAARKKAIGVAKATVADQP